MTTTTDRRAIATIVVATREVILQEYSRDSCIASSLIGQKVFAHYGQQSRIVPTTVSAYNEDALKYRAQGIPAAAWPQSAWSVGVHGTGAMDMEAKRYDGHLVLVLRRPGKPRLLVDLSADQLDRPERGLEVPGPVAIALPKVWTPQDFAEVIIDGPPLTKVEYAPLAVGEDWRAAKDANDEERQAGYVARIIELCDKRFSEG